MTLQTKHKILLASLLFRLVRAARRLAMGESVAQSGQVYTVEGTTTSIRKQLHLKSGKIPPIDHCSPSI